MLKYSHLKLTWMTKRSAKNLLVDPEQINYKIQFEMEMQYIDKNVLSCAFLHLSLSLKSITANYFCCMYQ